MPQDLQQHPADRIAAGKALRDRVRRESHGPWKRDKAKVDPLAILRASDKGRDAELLPIRYGRMLQSPFTFYRGAAAVMAADLARTPYTGIRVQACGDCHLLNFGGFATPERNVLLDINDFDETLPAPWEWDVKRLAASFVLAARSNSLSDAAGRDAAVACARSYRRRMREYARMSPLDVWYARITAEDAIAMAPDKGLKGQIVERVAKATARNSSDIEYPKLTDMVGGHVRIRDTPPLIYHPAQYSPDEFHAILRLNFDSYRQSLPDDRRALVDRYRFVDAARKVVGIGSVGTVCYVLLLMSAANEPLFLQWKEARPSVLEPYAGASVYRNHGERVVNGQRLMQPASDLFLGWLTGKYGRIYYVRQLRDAKIKPLVESLNATRLTAYAKLCGWGLARAHAKVGDALAIGAYLGKHGAFDEAIGRFSIAYADRTERDHAALTAAVRAGKVQAYSED